MVSNDTNHKEHIVACIGRWMPLHNGHKEFLIKLAKEYGEIVVMIGSCYENGTERNCIPAVEREKMLHSIFKREDVGNYKIVHVPDTQNFEEWILNVKEICNKLNVTHFCTGNKEDILDVLKAKGEEIGFEMVDPNDYSGIPYCATDIRKLIIQGKYLDLEKMIPDEVKPILFKNTFKEILASSQKRGIKFVPGRQTVDVILLIRNSFDGKVYVLLGKRSVTKDDFPGYLALPGGGIEKFESPILAAIRVFEEKTGFKINLLDNSLEPAIVNISNVPSPDIEQMHFVGIYSKEDKNIAGSKGGSSQCFGIFIEDEIYKYEEYLNPQTDFTDVHFYDVNEVLKTTLAFQHGDMLRKALNIFEAYPDLRAT